MRKNVSIIFDIDGTLIDSYKVAGIEYKKAIETVLPETTFKPEWKDYQNVTDSGIIIEVLSDNAYDLPVRETVSAVKEVFMHNISQQLSDTPCAEIIGGQDFLKKCVDLYQVGIATGCWKESGEVKLETAGYDIGNTYMSSSCDYDSREDILQNCLSQIGGEKENVIYFGDAVWDIKTTENLGWHFIGIGEKVKGLCSHWFQDYSDQNQILKAVSTILA